MNEFVVKTRQRREVVDITDDVLRKLPTDGSGVATVFVRHTTCAIAVIDMDPGMGDDLLDAVAGLLPRKQWRHPHDNSYEHVTAHLLGGLIGPSATVPYEYTKFLLGTWQRIVLIELEGPRARQIVVAS